MNLTAVSTLLLSASLISSLSAQSVSGVLPGKVLFPNSCSEAAQRPFNLGLLALHNFEYADAAELFAQTRSADPHCAIASWGEAMTYWHELWEAPDAGAIAAGKAAVNLAQGQEQHATPREKSYIAAIAAYYLPPAGIKGADAYTARMKALHAAYPADSQATLFYALALIATEPDEHAARLAQAREAGALAGQIFKAEPWNPGAAHYMIHAYDEPELAQQALAAARAYAKIAPDAPHALHMPAHIFVQLGLWQEDVDSNLASYRAASRAAGHLDQRLREELHALNFLQYAQLQLGQFAAATKTTGLMVQIARAHPGARNENSLYGVAWQMPIETEDWASVAAIPAPDSSADKFWQAEYAWLQTMAAGELRQPERATEWLSKYRSAEQAAKPGPDEDKPMLLVMEQEAEGWEAFARGDSKAAITSMQAADRSEADPMSGIYPRKPAKEMLADMQLALGHKKEAAANYRAVLEQHQGRRLSKLDLRRPKSEHARSRSAMWRG
ncbi:MAG TPA: hypothetical protein VGD59_14015 [Acidisarcina sp.]